MKLTKRRWGLLIVIFAIVALSAYALRPNPIAADAARVTRGPLEVTIDEDGQTRVREKYVVAAPVAGRLQRIDVHAGDLVDPSTVLVRLHPAPLNATQRTELEARVQSAEQARREAEAVVKRAKDAYAQAKRESARLKQLSRESIVPAQNVEEAVTAEAMRAKDVEASRFAADAAAFNVDVARAGLLALEDGGHEISICAPVRGRVLRVMHESESVVPAGATLIEIGDPAKLEIVLDLLTTDAVRVHPGDELRIEEWGGDRPLRARVRVVEPSAFTKISALGVEEQRVNVIGDFVDDAPLGDGYRVEGRVVIWRGDVARVPSTALFRSQNGWALYSVENGRVRLRRVTTGHRSANDTEIVSGIDADAVVIAHPSDQIREGVRVTPRWR